jgi:hypothetical protein
LQALDRALQRSFDPQTHPVSVKVEVQVTGDAAVALVRVATVPLVRDDCGLTLGDVLQNFRAALDHLAWDLVKIGATPKPAYPQGIYFPMAPSHKSFSKTINTKLPGVPKGQRAVVRRYQPYRRGMGPQAVRRLRDLSDHDKHRVVVPVTRNVSPHLNIAVESNWLVTSLRYLVTKPIRLKVNTPLMRIDLARPRGLAADCQVGVNGQFPVYPALPHGAPSTALMDIRDTVLEILNEFDAML